MPFILRGVTLLGIDSVNTPMEVRRKVWERLAGDLKPRHLQSMAITVELSGMAPVFDKILKSQFKGRAVVRVGG
jgi:NADPH2:quinone reductase